MPEAIYNEACRDASLRAILTYNQPCNICCECVSKKKQSQRKRLPKTNRRKKKHHKRRDQTCPQYIDRIAQPLNRRLTFTLQQYSNVFDTERVIKVCRLIHELKHPQPQPASLMKEKQKKRRCLRAKACCRSAKLKAQWLDKQTTKSGNRFIKYLGALRQMIPNYKQLQVTMMLYKLLNFRRIKTCNRFVKEELRVLCQKLAILIDVKLQPYKQEFVVDQISATTLENKHCFFTMFDYVPPESEIETELIYEEEASVVGEGSLFVGEEPIFSEWEEEVAGLAEEEEEGKGLELKEGELGEGEEGEMAESIMGEEGIEGQISELEGMSLLEISKIGGEGESLYGSEKEEEFYAESEEEESLLEVEEEAAKVGVFEEEEVSIFEAAESIAEEEAGLLDYHPEGTSSYVDWCLYVSWLKELGRNIQMYSNCLQQFRETLQADEASKFEETIRFILKNWSNYLAESNRVDKAMVQYFKDKPMTWCTMCRDCTIDDYPPEHYIPPELKEVITTTKHWRRLLAEAEEYCNLLSRRGKEEGEGEEVEEVYEIFDVGSSSSSSFDITALDRPK